MEFQQSQASINSCTDFPRCGYNMMGSIRTAREHGGARISPIDAVVSNADQKQITTVINYL